MFAARACVRLLLQCLPTLHPAKRTWLAALGEQLRAAFPEQKQELLDALVAKADPDAKRILELYARPKVLAHMCLAFLPLLRSRCHDVL